tara:strand:- start:4247 stop:4906 length:660 start_codon:yes stop_codon:yes gene_type:complete
MVKRSFILHIDSLDVIDELNDQQVADLFRAIIDYQKTGKTKLKGLMKVVFIPFKNQFIRDNDKYDNKCEINKINGKKGGRPKQNPTVNKKPNKTQRLKSKPKKPYNDNDNDNDKENIKENISFLSPTKLNINDYDLKFSDKLKDKFIQFLEMNNMSNLHTLTEQIEIVNNYLKKYTEQQIIDSLKYAISKNNKSFNPKWIKKQPDSNGFTFLTDKDIHN